MYRDIGLEPTTVHRDKTKIVSIGKNIEVGDKNSVRQII